MQNSIHRFSPATARVLSLLSLLLASLGCSSAFAATVTTDLPDYSPGMMVVISGAGWQAGETVTFHIEATCGCPHSDWITIAAADGTILNNDFLVLDIHINQSFVLTATGQSSGLTAQTTFTDQVTS